MTEQTEPVVLSTSCLICGMPALWHSMNASTISHEYDSEFHQNQSTPTEGPPISSPAQPQTTSTTTTTDASSAGPSEEVRSISSTGAEKGVKPDRQSLIPVPALQLLGRLYGKGAEKYAAHNWRKGYEWSKSYDAAMRHMQLFWEGEDIDPEMGLPHVTCATFHMMALATFMIEHPEMDDRFKPDKGDLAFEEMRRQLGIYLSTPREEPKPGSSDDL